MIPLIIRFIFIERKMKYETETVYRTVKKRYKKSSSIAKFLLAKSKEGWSFDYIDGGYTEEVLDDYFIEVRLMKVVKNKKK